MEQQLARYYELKEAQKKIEEELNDLRQKLLADFAETGEAEAGAYKLTIHYQERREYHDERVYNALPDPSLWRLMSRADAGKIASLLKLNVIHDGILEGTYELKHIPVLRVQKR
ncbi:hypothetical protein FOI68_17295 [Brevibacillus sp. LEMMJ03]|jgi:hypothetical protein|uniref:hypothetical protein n=1 Tax=Brevibacillus sp. LEMMJ03 TaxID=2595056 RepID=UPI00117D46C7|nr:hypothetical protein [Brevibacillus sp. LEMMJ03]TRY24403.1 hypothetical protein FOI68_17295 [Brevibacillus sp. LEMMJ03]